MIRRRVLLLPLLTWAACESSPFVEGIDGGIDAPPDAPQTDAETAQDGEVEDNSAPPEAGGTQGCGAFGSPCTPEDRGCSSGDAVEIACRSFTECRNGRWSGVTIYLAACGAGGPNACPAGVPAAGASCPVEAQLCSYPDGVSCACATGCETGTDAGADAGPCRTPGPPIWICSGANGVASSDCPMAAPQLGDPCGAQSSRCTYGHYCAAYYQVGCVAGRWELADDIGGCK
jgi:hypothetical protein